MHFQLVLYGVMCPADHDFHFPILFYIYIVINISKNTEKTQTNYL